MYRPEWFGEIARGRGVAQIAVDVHSTTIGSMERSGEAQGDDIRALSWVLENWQRSNGDFDDCIRSLIELAVSEAI